MTVNRETGFAIELLALIALGLQGTASFGRREGSLPLRLVGVFEAANPPQKLVITYGQ